MDQAQPETPRPGLARGTHVLTAFGESPEQIRAEMHKAFARFEATAREHQSHWLTAPAEGRWSPAQVTEHVLMVNESVGRILTLLLSDHPLPEQPGTAGERRDGKRLAPAGLIPGEGQVWSVLYPRWTASVAGLDDVAARLDGADLSRQYHHPFLGRIDARDWLRMVTYHTRHHRAQLTEGAADQGPADQRAANSDTVAGKGV